MATSHAISLRPGTQTDFGRLAEIELAAAQLFPPGRVPDSEDTLATELLMQGVADNMLWVAQQQSQAVGFTLCVRHEVYLHLLEVAVHPNWGQQGIGRSLVTQVLAQARALDLPGVTLTTFRDLAFNGPFYQSMGFEEIPAAQRSIVISDILAAEEREGMVQRIGMLCRI